jgi:hypothetical protein
VHTGQIRCLPPEDASPGLSPGVRHVTSREQEGLGAPLAWKNCQRRYFTEMKFQDAENVLSRVVSAVTAFKKEHWACARAGRCPSSKVT